MSSNSYLSLATKGLSAARPTTLELPIGFYYATDTGVLSFWTGSSWLVLATGGTQVGVVASTTHTLAGATQLTFGMAVIGTCANAGDAVKLQPNPQPRQEQLVVNNGAQAAAVFPGESTTTVDGGSAGASVPLSAGKSTLFVCHVAGAWTSAVTGGHSA